MKVYNELSTNTLSPPLMQLLEDYRQKKAFNAQQYLHIKAQMLNIYMSNCGLKSCVVAVSGGIDSACVLGLVSYASRLKDSPIEKILPVLLPVSQSVGATGQDEATSRGQEVCQAHGLEPFVIELSPIHEQLQKTVSAVTHIEGGPWAKGQLVAHTRTPTLYYCATLLTQNDLPAIIVGTTNRDEGLYLGYFGKASDGLVDVQLISDLHKSEVYAVAKILKTPQSIMNVCPQGDMYDGRIDEEVFGAPYDFVEYYLHYLTLPLDEQNKVLHKIAESQINEVQAKDQFSLFSKNLENLHKYNRHKYMSASPAIHLDIDYMDIKEGWRTNCLFNRQSEKNIDTSSFVGLMKAQQLPSYFTTYLPDITSTIYEVQGKTVYCLDNVFSTQETAWLLANTEHNIWKNANKYGKATCNQERVMSQRMSDYNTALSEILYRRIKNYLPFFKCHTAGERPLIFGDNNLWITSGINPLFRYIRYHDDQKLVAHYDDTYEYHSHKKTLMSAIIYLQSSEALTRFIFDEQQNLPQKQRDYSDWDTMGERVLLSIPSIPGRILIFDHRMLHDATAPQDEEKTIIRTDIVFSSPQLGFSL